jgi:hypothetical protein
MFIQCLRESHTVSDERLMSSFAVLILVHIDRHSALDEIGATLRLGRLASGDDVLFDVSLGRVSGTKVNVGLASFSWRAARGVPRTAVKRMDARMNFMVNSLFTWLKTMMGV